MIDVHCHLLPGIDDGSKSLDISLQLARDAVADGITAALMTPHHMNGHYTNHRDDVIKATQDFQLALNDAQIPLTVFPSQEVRITGKLLEALDQHDILTTDETGHYILIEFPSNDVPTFSKDVLYEVQQRGITPIIVHPERNTRLMAKPDILYDFIDRGAYAQVTASSYVGTFGKAVQKFSDDIVRSGLAHLFASDAHHLPGRTYEMSAAFERLAQQMGDDYVAIYQENARALVNGDALTPFEAVPIKKKKFFSAY
ncbi:CpsB/CapC family capsule biosynthesis tyrosine phosphatase [Leuconostoc fallax]|uniref:tyrosine-protein phosphatase n=1 Tax=Leuconostoc fallax TaxID=1251 RepID=UPI00209110BF|nr:CpsB/CapC family capsule biosynthesis tyrosine phosphatase [Leuconostoc fallax]MCO6183188.1 tyrosine protein phosphatase [Leuconostoc fallax]